MKAQLGFPCVQCGEVLELEPLITLDEVTVFWFDCEACEVSGPAILEDD